MAERVELRADLSDLGDDELLVGAAAVRARIVARALGEDFEAAAGGKRHAFLEDLAKLEHLAGLDQPRGA